MSSSAALLAAGKKQEAEVAFGQAVSIQEKLEKDFAAKPEHRHDLARSHAAAASLLRDARRTQDAEKINQLALTHWQKLVAQDPDNLEYLQNLAGSYHKLGTFLVSRGRRRDAEEVFLRALRSAKLLPFPRRTSGPAGSRAQPPRTGSSDLADQYRSACGAEKHYWAALQFFDTLHAEFPDNAHHWHFLADTHRCLGRILGITQKPHEAEKAYRQAIELHEQRAAKLPDTSEYRWEWPLAYSNLASQLMASGRTQEAKDVFRQAAASFSRAIDLNSKIWWLWSSRGEAYAELGEWDKAEADFAKVVELAPEQAVLHYHLALARLRLADTKRYQETCADMVMRFGHSPDLNAAYLSAWTCVWIRMRSPISSQSCCWPRRPSLSPRRTATSSNTSAPCSTAPGGSRTRSNA